MSDLGTAVLVFLGSVATAYGLYRGTKRTADSASVQTIITTAAEVETKETDAALLAWQNLYAASEQRVAKLESRMEALEDKGQKRMDATSRQIDVLTERVDLLTTQVNHWRRLARSMARLASRLRGEVIRLGGDPGAMPEDFDIALEED